MAERSIDPAAAAAALEVTLEKREVTLLSAYLRELRFWNRRMNLVSAAAERDLWIRHVVDSVAAAPFLEDRNARMIDLGSGAGFPGIPLQIVVPSLRVSLLEASRKKSSFLRHVARILALPSLTVLTARAEDLVRDGAHRHAYGVVVSRASFPLPELLAVGVPFLSPGGQLIAYHGKLRHDIGDLHELGRRLGLGAPARRSLCLPGGGGERNLLIFRNVA